MLLAVLERRAGMKLNDKDVSVSTVGGVKLSEPGADLAIAIAIASAFSDKPIAHTVAAFGEISLAGEIRPVTGAKQRDSEASRLGFTTRIDHSAGTLRSALKAAFDTSKDAREKEIEAAF
jgi:DNA repair protein RadA/Sms